MKNCFCGTAKPFSSCCNPLIKGTLPAESAEKLMRSRYSAYVTSSVDYLVNTTHISKRGSLVRKDITDWAKSNVWLSLEILYADENTVEFKAHFRDRKGKKQVHHEKSSFVFEDKRWFYLDGTFE